MPREVGSLRLPEGFGPARLCLPGVLAVTGPKYSPDSDGVDRAIGRFCDAFRAADPICRCPLVVGVDDAEFAARTLNNILWVTFTRSDPAADLHGIESFTVHKHWGCRGSLVIDARTKPQHAPRLVEDPEVTRRVDALAVAGGPLSGII